MQRRILDLDGSLLGAAQPAAACRIVPLRHWGPRLRMGCSFAAFRRFEAELADALGPDDDSPGLTFVGSGDFHHVSLALLRRLRTPFNLLVLDHHPDWMRAVPLLHCGTWLHHASRLPHCRRIFHVGGDMDFDNTFRWLAPWAALRCGRLTVLPAVRRFHGRAWDRIPHEPLRFAPQQPADARRLFELIGPYRDELKRRPLYVSLDKDVLTPEGATVNWESGHLRLSEVQAVLRAFIGAAGHRVAGMDVVGDWSRVEAHGLLRRWMAWSEHPALHVNAAASARLNGRTNRALVAALAALGVLDRNQGVQRAKSA